MASASNEDSFWQAREIARTQLNAELVTLSACDVGSGLIVGEESISNLVRPFLIAWCLPSGREPMGV
jgi:CHAT domain-containing protein